MPAIQTVTGARVKSGVGNTLSLPSKIAGIVEKTHVAYKNRIGERDSDTESNNKPRSHNSPNAHVTRSGKVGQALPCVYYVAYPTRSPEYSASGKAKVNDYQQYGENIFGNTSRKPTSGPMGLSNLQILRSKVQQYQRLLWTVWLPPYVPVLYRNVRGTIQNQLALPSPLFFTWS